MTDETPIEDVRRGVAQRFQSLGEFVRLTSQWTAGSAPEEIVLRRQMYSAWVLLTYAAFEGSIVELSRATVDHMALHAKTPERLPERLKYEHQKRLMLGFVALTEGEWRSSQVPLSALDSEEWHKHTSMLALGGNAWPDRVKDWLARLGVPRTDMEWLDRPHSPDSSESRSSRISELCSVRNEIAHGDSPNSLKSRELMAAWIDEICWVSIKLCAMAQLSLCRMFPFQDLTSLGDVDRTISGLGDSTVAFEIVNVDLSIGDHVLGRRESGSGSTDFRVSRVLSMRQNNVALDKAVRGDQRVAVTLSKSAVGYGLFRAM